MRCLILRTASLFCMLTVCLWGCCFAAQPPPSIQPPLIIAYENTTNNTYVTLLQLQLKKLGYDFLIVGQGQTWTNTAQVIGPIHKRIQRLDPERIVVVIDSRDIVPMRPAHAFTRTIDRMIRAKAWNPDTVWMGREFIAGAHHPGSNGVRSQKYYYPGELIDKQGKKTAGHDGPAMPFWRRMYPLLHHIAPHQAPILAWRKAFSLAPSHLKHNIPFAFPNSGFYMANAKTLDRIYTHMQAQATERDQHLFQEYYLAFPEDFTFDDARSVIYHVSPKHKKLPGTWNAQGVWTSEVNTRPFFTHYYAKNFEAYMDTYAHLQDANWR